VITVRNSPSFVNPHGSEKTSLAKSLPPNSHSTASQDSKQSLALPTAWCKAFIAVTIVQSRQRPLNERVSVHWRDMQSSDTRDAPGFPYEALNFHNHEIRILTVTHQKEEGNYRFKGILEHVSLINTTPYTALSYCWGPPSSDRYIQLGTSTSWANLLVAITENLYQALRALWRRKGNETKLRIWVDALCS
jgi:Heterokaryon incompatibility protein (HET)